MKSPFPGMDPYIEAHWGDVQPRLMVYVSNELNAELPDDLRACVEEQLTLEDEPQTLRHLEIVDTDDGSRAITVIEILSPVNKVGSTGQLAYIRKQREYLEAGVNLVEIGLIRAGNYVLAVPEDSLSFACRTPYLICVSRPTRRGRAELYAVPLRQPLPNIAIPLRPADNDVVLRLQPLLDDCYRDGRYSRINYRDDPVPPLEDADARWADSILREKGLR
ncbi:MAG: DUF4058 family protein [Planctomycetes bacterium]|nr:DUF4058 family protein [Planctomycetota bacterium]